jgi:hypothetical protein
VYDAVSESVLSPLEDGEMQSATPLKEDMKVASPSEASVKVKVFDSKNVKAFDPSKNRNNPYCSKHDQKGRNQS